jgi:hypothetical protein
MEDKEKDKNTEDLNDDEKDANAIDPAKKGGTGLGLKSRSGSETELETDSNIDRDKAADDVPDPTDRLRKKEDLRRGLNNSNPNNQRNNSNTLLDNE